MTGRCAAALLSACWAVGLLPFLTACRETESKSPPVRVDCQRLCKRNFEECADEVFLASGKMSEKKLKLFKKLTILRRIKQEGLTKCLKECRALGGVGAESAELNRCLELKDCRAYARCVEPYVREKKKSKK